MVSNPSVAKCERTAITLFEPISFPRSQCFVPSRGGARGKNLQILEVPTRKVILRNDLNLAIGHLLHHNNVAEVAGPAIDLDALLEKLFEGVDIENLVACGLRGIDDELDGTAC